MEFPRAFIEADATRPKAKSLMPVRGSNMAVQSGNVAQFAIVERQTALSTIVERQTAITVPGALAPGQNEDYA